MHRVRKLALVAACAVLALPATPATAADPPPSVTIVAPRTHFVANTTVVVPIEVKNGNNRQILAFIKASGQSGGTLCGGGDNVTEVTIRCAVYMYVNTEVYVTVDGSVVATQQFYVRPQMSTEVRSAYARSGRYYVLGHGVSPRFESGASPARPGSMCLRHEVQRLRNNVWSTVKTSGCRTMTSKKVVDWTWTGTHPSRVSFRVRATFPGDAYNAGGPGVWTYFRFS